MTPRRVHYWLDTGLLSEPLVRGSRGTPTLLTFRQLLEIRTVQRLRDELAFSLGEVREAVDLLLHSLFEPDWTSAVFIRGVLNEVVVKSGQHIVSVPKRQGVLPVLPELERELEYTRRAWENQAYVVPAHPAVVSDARVLAGAPTVRGTRIETSLLATFAPSGAYDKRVIKDIRGTFPRLTVAHIRDALRFEGIRAA
jgi:uncharacterized protein (DUF433 family)/DNA-binding transcriptional MerR regulator